MRNSIRSYNILLGTKKKKKGKDLCKMNRSYNVLVAEKMIKRCMQDDSIV